MPETRTLCVVGAGAEAADGIATARDMGLHVVATDADPEAPGFAVANDRILASTYDVEETTAAVRAYHERVRRVDGVLCIASDVPLTVAHVARAVGAPGLSLEAAHLASDKLAMKERFARDGVAIPAFAPVDGADDLADLIIRHGHPLVVKPVDSRGARGVLRLAPDVDLAWAYHFARRHSPTGRVMVERFLAGPQVSTESLVVDGTVHTVGMSDRNYELLDAFAPHMIENGGALPTRHGEKTRKAIRELVAAAARSLGIHDGVVKGDIVVHEGVPHVIEIAARARKQVALRHAALVARREVGGARPQRRRARGAALARRRRVGLERVGTAMGRCGSKAAGRVTSAEFRGVTTRANSADATGGRREEGRMSCAGDQGDRTLSPSPSPSPSPNPSPNAAGYPLLEIKEAGYLLGSGARAGRRRGQGAEKL